MSSGGVSMVHSCLCSSTLIGGREEALEIHIELYSYKIILILVVTADTRLKVAEKNRLLDVKLTSPLLSIYLC